MGADNSADTCRSVAEAMRYAGVNGITLPSHQVIRLTVNGQHDFTLQYGAYLFTLMLDPLPVVVPGWYVSNIIASVRFGLPL